MVDGGGMVFPSDSVMIGLRMMGLLLMNEHDIVVSAGGRYKNIVYCL